MTQGISGYAGTSTDDLLSRALEDSGDDDPTRVRADTGRALHFDATDSPEAHQAGLQPSTTSALETGGVILGGKAAGSIAYDRACGFFAKQVASPLLRAGAGVALEGVSAITSLGTLYNEAIEHAHHEDDPNAPSLRATRASSG